MRSSKYRERSKVGLLTSYTCGYYSGEMVPCQVRGPTVTPAGQQAAEVAKGKIESEVARSRKHRALQQRMSIA